MKKCNCNKVGVNDVEYKVFAGWGLPFCKKCGGAMFNVEKAEYMRGLAALFREYFEAQEFKEGD